MNERFVQKAQDSKVRHDIAVLADFVQIWCDGHHDASARRPIQTEAQQLGVYAKKLQLCPECEAHLAYAEKRRAYCPKDPKPFCAHCDTHCYMSSESEWQQQMMRYSGPKSWRKGHAIDGVKHMLEGRKWRRRIDQDARTQHNSAH